MTRNLVVLSGVSFLQDTASELLYPILPIFLTSILGAPVAVVGLIEGLAEGAASVTKLAAGWLGDRMRRRRLIGAGYGLAAVGKGLIAVATLWPVVLAGRAVDRLGKGVRDAPRDALLVVGVPPEVRGRVFGFHRAMDTAGAVVGPLLGLAGYELLSHRIRPLLVIAVVPATLSVLLVLAVDERPAADPPAPDRLAPDRPAPDRPAPDPPAANRPATDTAGRSLGSLGQLPARYWHVVVVLGVFSVVNFPDALLILRLRALHFSVVTVILAYVTYNAVYALLSYPAGSLADRWPKSRVFGIGLVFFSIGYLGLGLVHAKVLAWLLLTVYGVFTAFTDGVGKSWISGLVPQERQSTAQGAFQGITGGAVLVAGIWAGLAWHRTGAIPLIISGTLAAVIAGYLLIGPILGGVVPESTREPIAPL
jgi:MFS family permease